ncbi:uncharacterized protein APUU_71086A [Aspergillus puulaauensis]|uniref:Uncharacterized protein n=1 Tax=Aspergillus puulaauensis TaxID=1220207 RepID=A0A7R8ASI9_9EURO|nr:uncharacterized protein APUU_71086A [Aspergillus puulaauensis]BCS29516.1 hypothetical protein APUU_71086A [Aspergillus puulaauensis]
MGTLNTLNRSSVPPAKGPIFSLADELDPESNLRQGLREFKYRLAPPIDLTWAST